jgi:L-asparaginase
VLATAGAGATSGTQGQGIQYATAHGAIVVTTTRTGSGRIAARNGGPPQRFGNRELSDQERRSFALRVAGEDLAPVKARILLMLALTKTSDPTEIQRMFTEY